MYATTINFPAGTAGQGLEFKFLLTTASWGNCNDISGANTQECLTVGDPCTNGTNDNRFYTIPSLNETICFEWNTCNVCTGLGIKQNLVNLANLAVSPNPSVNNTVISYGLVSNENVQVRVYNSLGAEVAVLANEAQAIGNHKINWNTSTVDKGLYTVVVRTATGTKSTRVAVQ
ncbi:MAG: T9SS type A sorting domain-containing protein [Bacteroidota bacterium]